MNKLVKGSIAGAAGIALLLGGAGTLATWNANATVVSDAKITAGTLNIEAAKNTTSWFLGKEEVKIADVKIVPGDTLTYTTTFNVTATGDNLEATVALGKTAISPVSLKSSADNELAKMLESGATFTVDGEDTTTVVASGDSQKVVVSVTIEFPKQKEPGAENDAMLGAVTLDKFSVTLTQN